MRKKAILFDLDDTLYPNKERREDAIKAAHKVFNEYHKIGFEEFSKLYVMCVIETEKELPEAAAAFNRALHFKRLFEKTHTNFEPDLILKLYEVYWNAFLKNIKPFPETIPTLKELKGMGIKTAIITNLTVHIQLRKLKSLGISEYIDVFVTSEETGKNKPHPSTFNLALNKLGLKPEEVMMVGDMVESDIEGANAAGIDSVLIATRELKDFPEGDLRKPNYVINNLKELLKLVE